ncbi:MAG: IS1634 family transposase [bacterium]
MYIRQTKTSSSSTGESYVTYRLVKSVRFGKKVTQSTLLNLGRHFSLQKNDWPLLCDRIELLLSGETELLHVSKPISKEIESLAQRYYSQLVLNSVPTDSHKYVKSEDDMTKSNPVVSEDNSIKTNGYTPVYEEVDVQSMELLRPRSVGVECVGLNAVKKLGLSEIFESVGLNGIQRSCAIASIIGRMAVPGGELPTWTWLRERSALGELLDVDFEGVALSQFYRVADCLVNNREKIESLLFDNIDNLFSLAPTVTLYDLTNTYFEGVMDGNESAKNGHSKEKRTDCPLVTLGLVLDGSGFIRRSRVFDGNISEATTLKGMLIGLDAPPSALVIMDRGIATENNISWLKTNNYKYLVVNRELKRNFDENQPKVSIANASNNIIEMQKVLSDDGKEVRLYCYSEKREEKEMGIIKRFTESFEKELTKLSDGLIKPRTEKRLDKVLERIGRLKERSHGISQHYNIMVVSDETGKKATSVTYEKTPIAGSMMTHPGVYCLRTNQTDWNEETLWKTYSMLTDLESVFRSLKSELGLRPVYHHTAKRTEGHLFITVLAYQCVQVIRKELREYKKEPICLSWRSLRDIFSVQQRVTVKFKQRNGSTLHIRKATVAEAKLENIYKILNISASPGGIKRMII